MELKATTPIAKMAVVTDLEKETSEVVRVDRLRLLGFSINYSPTGTVSTEHGNMELAFGWGGYDSGGNFHFCATLGHARRSINSSTLQEGEIWKACAFDEKGNPRTDAFGLEFFKKLLFDSKVNREPLINSIVNGGWTFETLELSHEDIVVFCKVKPVVIKAVEGIKP